MLSLDCHAHILPVDHGSADVEQSLAQLRQAALAHITTIIATPHFYPDQHLTADFFAQRDEALRQLAVRAPADAPRVLPGAEVLLCEGLQHLPELEQLCLARSRALLIEMPDPPWGGRYLHTLAAIKKERGLQVLLAHPERYPADLAEYLFALGYPGQLNAQSLLTPLRWRRCLRWIKQGFIWTLGSDNHGADGKGYQAFAQARRRLGKQEAVLENYTAQLFAEA